MREKDRKTLLEYFRNRGSPNPERIGCPEKSVLAEIASGSLSPESPWYDHLRICTECLAETEQLQSDSAKGNQ